MTRAENSLTARKDWQPTTSGKAMSTKRSPEQQALIDAIRKRNPELVFGQGGGDRWFWMRRGDTGQEFASLDDSIADFISTTVKQLEEAFKLLEEYTNHGGEEDIQCSFGDVVTALSALSLYQYRVAGCPLGENLAGQTAWLDKLRREYMNFAKDCGELPEGYEED